MLHACSMYVKVCNMHVTFEYRYVCNCVYLIVETQLVVSYKQLRSGTSPFWGVPSPPASLRCVGRGVGCHGNQY